MGLIEQTEGRYLRAPQLVANGVGGATLYVVAWEGNHERVLGFEVDAAGGIAEPAEVCTPCDAIAVLDLDHGGDQVPVPRPSLDSRLELRACSGNSELHVRHHQGQSQVWLRNPGLGQVLVWQATGIAAAPALAVAPGGTWLAFHHNVRESDLRPDVAKWIALRFVDLRGRVLEPATEMCGLDRELRGIEQSFEFPALVVADDGALSLFGRGSHNFWRQDLHRAGFGERKSLSDGEWGARGRRVAAALLNDGRVMIARRERKGIQVDILAGPSGGAPALVAAQVRLQNATAPGLAARAANSADPARQHGYRTYFGDIQQHSAHSDGVGSADEVYLRARDCYGDDFVALTDHESFLGKRTGPGEWAYLQDVAERHNVPGEFTALIAYEWTGKRYPGPGHKCVYLPRPGLPIISRDQVPSGRELVAAVAAQGGFSSPHHIGWTGADEPGHEPYGQPLWEICSCHGCYEHADHPLGQRGELRDQMVDEMLRRGHRFGFTASSDSHGLLWHHGECRKRDPYRTGLTGVQAEACTREAIFAALRARRCYATSGAKILLDMRVQDAPMGSELAVAGPVTAWASARGVKPLSRLEFVGPQGVLARVGGEEQTVELRSRVHAPWVYARTIQTDGEMAWSSPVFLGPPR